MPPGIAAMFGPRSSPASQQVSAASAKAVTEEPSSPDLSKVEDMDAEEAPQAVDLQARERGTRGEQQQQQQGGTQSGDDVRGEARSELLIASHPGATITLFQQEVIQSQLDREADGPWSPCTSAHQQLGQLLLIRAGRLAARLSASSLGSRERREHLADKLSRVQDELQHLARRRQSEVQAGLA
jgi:hypothetical protein